MILCVVCIYRVVFGRTEEAQVAVAHAVFCEVGGVRVKPFTNVGDCIPVDHDGWLQGVSKCEGLLDCLCQLVAIETIVVPEREWMCWNTYLIIYNFPDPGSSRIRETGKTWT
jgi:hypothetical protein